MVRTARAAAGGSYVIEVFVVPQRRPEVELVQARAAAEHELFTEVLVVGDLDDQPRAQEILFDLLAGRPSSSALPVGAGALTDGERVASGDLRESGHVEGGGRDLHESS
jgi:hypothetical protein